MAESNDEKIVAHFARAIAQHKLFFGGGDEAYELARDLFSLVEPLLRGVTPNEPRTAPIHPLSIDDAFDTDPSFVDEPPMPGYNRELSPAEELAEWWISTASAEIEPLIAKMQEYGGMGRAIDLEEIGRGLINSGVSPWESPGDGTPRALFEIREHQELGIYFYLLGKFARWTAAVKEGRPVSDDTLLDIGIYVRMVQRIRQKGGWPQ